MRLPILKGALAALLAGLAMADVPHSTDLEAYNAGALGDSPNQTFHSSPIVAPIIQVTTLDKSKTDPAPYLFLEWAYEDVFSPMIFRTDDLSLVYAGQQYEWVMDVRAQTLGRKKLLTFWEGEGAERYGNGQCVAFDEDYNLEYSVTPIGLETDSLADLHECQVTEEDTVLIIIYEPIPWDLTPVGGEADGMLIDCLFQEINPRTGELVFEWRATEHYDLEDTMSTIETDMLSAGFDWYHLNSVAKYGSNYLIGSSDLDHIALIDGTTGTPIWTLGGNANEFRDISGGGALRFSSQHQPRFLGDEDHIVLFDNGPDRVDSVGCTADCARGLHLTLDYDAMTVEVAGEYSHPLSLKALAQGGFMTLENGNALVAWGSQPGITEHKGDEVVMDIQFGRIVDSPPGQFDGSGAVYRPFKGDWKGTPPWDPSIAVVGETVYVSWNGATEVAGWLVLGSHRANDIHGRSDDDHHGGDDDDNHGGDDDDHHGGGNVLAKSERRGFETAIPLDNDSGRRYLRAAATDSKGKVIGYTPVWDCTTGEAVAVDEG